MCSLKVRAAGYIFILDMFVWLETRKRIQVAGMVADGFMFHGQTTRESFISQVMLGLFLHCQFATTFFHLFRKVSCRHMDATKFDEVGPKKSNPCIVNDV